MTLQAFKTWQQKPKQYKNGAMIKEYFLGAIFSVRN